MGSLQQIFLGAICVGGAFLMGHYLHQPTPTHSPFEGKTTSAESSSGEENLNQRREPTALLPNFRTQSKLAPLFQKDQDLPPPSQLEGLPANPSLSRESTSQLDLADQELDIEVPDFSQLAAQFKGMALELPALNTAPPIVADSGSVTKAPPNNSNPQVLNPSQVKEELSNSTLNGPKSNDISGLDQRTNPHVPANAEAMVPNFHTTINPAEDLIKAERESAPRINPVTESTETSFRPEDFAPRLRVDNSGSGINPINSNSESGAAFPVTDLSEVSPFPHSQSVLENNGGPPQAPHPKAVISYNDPFPNKVENRTEAGRPTASINPPTEFGSGLEPSQSSVGSSGQNPGQNPGQDPGQNPGQNPGQDKRNPGNPAEVDRGLGDGNSDQWSVRNRDAQSELGQPRNSSAATAASMPAAGQIPFRLNEMERSRLSRLNLGAPQSNSVQATRFEEYRTETGDTLTSIANKFYGKPEYYLDIYLANRNQLRTPAEVPAGIILKLPVYE